MKVPLRVLIAEDDEDDREMLRDSLVRVLTNPEIITVHDGEQAIDYLLRRNKFEKVEHIPDLMILDLSLPRHDGFSVLRTVRSTHSLLRMPVYVVSTSSNTDDWRKSISLGANGFYRKGATMMDLLRVVQDISKKHFSDN